MINDIISYDKIYLTRALKLALKGRFTTMPNPNVGCVIVRDNQIVGEGYHVKAGEAHAEINALQVAGSYSKGATAYVTLEPCSHYGRTPPCTSALINAGVKRVVVAMLDPNPYVEGHGLRILNQAGIDVLFCSQMLPEAELINKGFIKRIKTGLPWITLKLASSLDGRTAMSSGESKWITCIQARQDVQRFRAENDVILSTAKTVLVDNPRLNVRWSFFSKEMKEMYLNNNIRQPWRVIIDSNNRVLPTHRIIKCEGKILLVRLKKDNYNWPSSVEQLLLPSVIHNGSFHVNLIKLMKYLAYKEVNNIWVEAGAVFSGILMDIGLVDELILYQSTKFLGSDARPLCFFSKSRSLNSVQSFKLVEMKNIGSDVRFKLIPNI